MTQRIRGTIASQGIRIGKAYVYRGDKVVVPKYNIPESWVDDELKRLEDTVKKTKEDIAGIQTQIARSLSRDMADIFASHLMVLEDPQIIDKARQTIRKERRNAEWVINDISLELMESMSNIEDEYLRERIVDLSDINKRLIANLQKTTGNDLDTINEEVIVIAPDLTPSETAVMDKDLVRAFVTDRGGRTSHTAIMARALEIPAIVGTREASSLIKNGDTVIVDAIHGQVIINPTDEDLKTFNEYQRAYQNMEAELAELRDEPSRTLDGTEVQLLGNIEIPEEMESIKEHKAHGIGLYRSEFLFLDTSLPDEERQYQAYRHVVENFAHQPVTIRTLDVGGDKVYAYAEPYREKNPFLGCRAIRFSLENMDIFRTQLRAILRASAHGDVKLMFPMISTVEEFIRARETVNEVMEELDREGLPFDRDIPVGIMVEVPSAVINADMLAKRADFFSVGTNDLVQYILAVDRISEKIAYLYNPLNPAVLRFLKQLIETARVYDTPVSLCGEIAGDFRYTMVLLGLGFRTLSMGQAYIYQVKKIIRSVSIMECEELTDELLGMELVKDIETRLLTLMKERFPEIFY